MRREAGDGLGESYEQGLQVLCRGGVNGREIAKVEYTGFDSRLNE